jgi:23S rRNA (adenine2030-N6)-methyltransferase
MSSAGTMKYRHAHHAGNFADVHKHVTLLALLAALARKEKGFLYLETHAGRGAYELGGESAGGYGRLAGRAPASPEISAYLASVAAYREESAQPHGYPGSPLLAAGALRAQDRAVLAELQPQEATALDVALGQRRSAARVRIERGDGFAQLAAQLPPPERRGLTFIDPPYEESARDFSRVTEAIAQALRRFATGCLAVWYPIKDERSIETWHAQLARSIAPAALVTQLWLYPRDSRVALNGSGLLIVNPPYLLDTRMREWLPELHERLRPGPGSGWSVRTLTRHRGITNPSHEARPSDEH